VEGTANSLERRCAERRASKLVSLLVSCFTGHYVALWPSQRPGQPLARPPMFDGRAVCYPTDALLRDYLAWRQVDTHINNQACALGSAQMAKGSVFRSCGKASGLRRIRMRLSNTSSCARRHNKQMPCACIGASSCLAGSNAAHWAICLQ